MAGTLLPKTRSPKSSQVPKLVQLTAPYFPREATMKLRLKPLRQQVIVITGASSGIGLVTARKAAAQGARVVAAARSDEDLTQLVLEIRSRGGKAVAVAADVGSEEDVRQ